MRRLPTIRLLLPCAGGLLTALMAAQDPGAGNGKPEGPFADLAQAARLLGQSRLQQAEKLLRSVVDRVPTHAHAWFVLGLARERQGKDELALSAMERVLDIDPLHLEGLLLASQLCLAKDRKKAAAYATRAGKAAREDEIGLRKAARLLVEVERFDQALAIVGKLQRRRPKDTELLYLQADLEVRLGKTDQALEAYRTLAPLRPFDPWPHECMAGLYLHLGNKQDARRSLLASLQIRPSNVHARRKLIEVMTDLGADRQEIAAQTSYLKLYEQVEKARGSGTPPGLPGPGR